MSRLTTILVVLMIGCFHAAESTPRSTSADTDPAQGGEAKPIEFDGKRSMKYLEEICAIGPRMSGTAGMRKQIELLKKHFDKFGAKIEEQTFQAKQVSRQNRVDMTNLIISWHPDRQRRVILCCHYDTRPIADQEPNKERWHKAFVSANDGGSGVAFMMEMAHHMKDLKTNVGVDFVIFDGEEYIFKPNVDKYFFGSEHFAMSWQKSKQRPQYTAAILLDMIAGKGAKFPVERYSWERAKPLAQQVWDIAAELKIDAFKREIGDRVLDDHLALQAVGIPAIDIIDFSYEHWHRLSDLPENCSAESMNNVARVLIVWLQRAK